jgi:hypothetical protein
VERVIIDWGRERTHPTSGFVGVNLATGVTPKPLDPHHLLTADGTGIGRVVRGQLLGQRNTHGISQGADLGLLVLDESDDKALGGLDVRTGGQSLITLSLRVPLSDPMGALKDHDGELLLHLVLLLG